jgi:4a-hydroxytetrahydrobiopterin dehydratase|tara:strand:- start:2869 stop:3135 length:267 start_codon:yes stop_codon:yes gene_type:complete
MFRELSNTLQLRLRFVDFVAAFDFMTEVAALAEAHQHHPEWRNVYNLVEITLTTHDAGNVVTEKDRALAQAIEQLPTTKRAEVLTLDA